MKEALPIKETVGISITSNPYLTGGPTRWPTPELSQNLITAVSQETQMEVLSPKPQRENGDYHYGSNDGKASFGVIKK